MACKLLQHVVEEADAGRDVELSGAVEVDGCGNVGLLGLARDGGLPLQSSPLGCSLRRRNRAFISLGLAVKGPPSRAASRIQSTGVQLQCKRTARNRSTPNPGTRPPYSPFVKMVVWSSPATGR